MVRGTGGDKTGGGDEEIGTEDTEVGGGATAVEMEIGTEAEMGGRRDRVGGNPCCCW